MVRMMVLAALVALPAAAIAQGSATQAPKTAGGGQATGQQNNQPSATQNQSQMQTDNAQQPPQAHVLPPTAASQNQPNPLPQLAK